MKVLNLIALPLLFSSLFAGCSSIMMFQGAKTVPQGSLQTGAGFSGGAYASRHTLGKFDLVTPSVAGNAWLRYGIVDSLDAGFNVAVPGNMTADAKWNFLKESDGHIMTASTGFGYGFSVGNSDEKASQVQRVTDYIFPLYLSRDAGKYVTFYAVPRYIYRLTYNQERLAASLPATSETIYDNMWGAGLGVMFNLGAEKKQHIMLECQRTAVFRKADFFSFQCGAGISGDWNLFGH